MNQLKRRRWRLYPACVLLALAACAGDEATSPAVPEPTLESLLRTGWSQFEAGSYARALDYFDQALAKEPAAVAGHLGRGWSLLKSPAAEPSLPEAAAAFDQALLLAAGDLDAHGGRAAVSLALGGQEIAAAVTHADFVLQQEPGYEFAHDPGFDGAALRLVDAQARVALADFAGALELLDGITVSGLSAADPDTWVVEGQVLDCFEAAVLAQLDRLAGFWARGDL